MSSAAYHVAFNCCVQLFDQSYRRRTQQVSTNANNVGLCCEKMLRPHDQGLIMSIEGRNNKARK